MYLLATINSNEITGISFSSGGSGSIFPNNYRIITIEYSGGSGSSLDTGDLIVIPDSS
jgi:hypothetical protein